MPRRVVVVTGAAGFLGSAITRNLAADHAVVAVDRRAPAAALRDETPLVDWHRVDIADRAALREVLRGAREHLGRVDVVIHLAAYYDFDLDWRAEYQRTNVDGTANVVDTGIEVGVERLIFASSMIAMLPAPKGQRLTEESPAASRLPYGRSKAIGESIVREHSHRLPAIVLRIGGVFSDWCELPPLSSLLALWTGSFPTNRILVGRGDTGLPYLHREDLVRLMRRCIERHRALGRDEVLLASQDGAVSHRELHESIRGARARPLRVSPSLARAGLALQRALGRVTGVLPYERPWMLQFVDRPWVADVATTREKLDWDTDPQLGVLARMPVLLRHLWHDRAEWDTRQAARVAGEG